MNTIPYEQRGVYTDSRGLDSALETYNVNTGERRELKRYDGVIEAPNWSRDGEHLYFNRQGRIVAYELNTGGEKEIGSAFVNACNNDHVLSPDGLSIAVSHQTWEDGQSRVYTLPLTGGTPRLVTPLAPSYLHGWSPDGSTLAYCAERDGQFDIYTVPVTGGRETRLTDTAGLDDGPEYSPCGRYIWFNSTRSGLMQLWRMNSDGSGQRQMTFDESNNWFPHVSPDGKWVVYNTSSTFPFLTLSIFAAPVRAG